VLPLDDHDHLGSPCDPRSRGSASLLEVLEAQRANNDVYLAYYAALNEQAKALVALEQSSGISDINF
jgi:outer membrane protein TolC